MIHEVRSSNNPDDLKRRTPNKKAIFLQLDLLVSSSPHNGPYESPSRGSKVASGKPESNKDGIFDVAEGRPAFQF